MTFARIENIKDLLPHLENHPEIRVDNCANGTTIVCYMLNDDSTFENEYLKECRGITFDTATGKIIQRPLHKFFNVNENEEVQAVNLDWSSVKRVMTKLDGSMITAGYVGNEIDFKTKKTFTSDVALEAKKFVREERLNILEFCKEICHEYTPVFEYMSPNTRIVILYEEKDMALLHVRNNITGEYMDLSSGYFKELADKHNVRIVSSDYVKNFSIHDVANMMRNYEKEENTEGSVIQFSNGDMVKLKTLWYFKLHRSITFLRERDIAALYLEDKLDDLKGYLNTLKLDTGPILQIEKSVKDWLIACEDKIEELYQLHKHLDRREFGITVQQYKNVEEFGNISGFIIKKYTGGNYSLKEFFAKTVLKEKFSLEQLNLSPVGFDKNEIKEMKNLLK